MPSLSTNPTVVNVPFIYKAIRPSAACTEQANDVWVLTQQDDCFIIPPENELVFTYKCADHGQMERLDCRDKTLMCEHNCTYTPAGSTACVDTRDWKDFTTFTCDLEVALNASHPYLTPDSPPTPPPWNAPIIPPKAPQATPTAPSSPNAPIVPGTPSDGAAGPAIPSTASALVSLGVLSLLSSLVVFI